ncbi:MAG: tRNA pseudouridine(55) synthase TruB [Microbacteriaceae bacterium]
MTRPDPIPDGSDDRIAERSGIVLVDKPGGMTSHDVVSRMRRLTGTRKIGHAGTLDPMATGLLVLGINSSTRLLTFFVGLDKEYLATIRLGASTTTDDAEGQILETARPESVDAVGPADLEREIGRLTGQIRQVPSSFSAIKVDGKRAYAVARSGESVELAARTVTVSAFEVLTSRAITADAVEGNGSFLELTVRIECSSGTYIRALARDLGAALGIGGHLTSLRRTRVGPFALEDATGLDTLDALDLADRILSPAEAACRLFPPFRLSADQATDLIQGKRIDGHPGQSGRKAALAPDGELIGIVTFDDGSGRAVVNFPAGAVPMEGSAL